MESGLRVLILVENLSVPFDRRVWHEARSLAHAGHEVVVVCPRGQERDAEALEVRERVQIHRYVPHPAAGGLRSYAIEYGHALRETFRLVRSLLSEMPFDVIHACNPPDFLLLAALPAKRRGARFIFDHHDLVPELYLSRFGGRRNALYGLALGFERVAFALADVVLATNESYRRVALTRGGKKPEDVFVVRNAPPAAFKLGERDEALKRGRPFLIAYVGIMGPQDGLDHALRALSELRRVRDDWHAIFVGSGDVLEEMRKLTRELDLSDHVEFTGHGGDELIVKLLSTADVCIAPEPSSPLNDVSTMIKVVEYMAIGRPIVAFDLSETRASAGEAAVYAPPNDERAFAASISSLLDNPERRTQMGVIGLARVNGPLSWKASERALLAAYQRAAGR